MGVFRVPNPLTRSATRNETGIHVLLHPSAFHTAPHLDEQDRVDTYVIRLRWPMEPRLRMPNEGSSHEITQGKAVDYVICTITERILEAYIY
jgi:hypothetical protein